MTEPRQTCLAPEIILVSVDTAGAVLGVLTATVRERIEAGHLAAFNFSAARGERNHWRVWCRSLTWGSAPTDRMIAAHVAEVFADLMCGSDCINTSQLELRAGLDPCIVSRLLRSGTLSWAGRPVGRQVSSPICPAGLSAFLASRSSLYPAPRRLSGQCAV